MNRYREPIALGVATVLVIATLFSIPGWAGALLDVCHLAAIFAGVTIPVFAVARKLGARGVVLERVWSAIFLAGMPVVYVVAWLTAAGGGTDGGRLAVELAGLPVYGGLAWWGLRRSPWFLVIGIAGHGLAWDAWHHFVASGYIPGWYITGCLVVDLGISLYLAVRIPAWRQAVLTSR